MQADFIKAFTSQASSTAQRPAKSGFLEKGQSKSGSFARELSQATQREAAPKKEDLNGTETKPFSQSSEPEKIERDSYQGKKKAEAPKDNAVTLQATDDSSEGNDTIVANVNQDIQAQVVSLLQLLGIDPQQVDGSLLEKLGALLNEPTGNGTVHQGNQLLKLLNQLTQMDSKQEVMSMKPDSSQIHDIKTVLEELVKQLDASGKNSPLAATDETLTRLRQLLSAFAEKDQSTQETSDGTKVITLQRSGLDSGTKASGEAENNGQFNPSFQLTGDNRHHTGVRKNIASPGENQELAAEQKSAQGQQQERLPSNAALQLENRNQSTEKLANQSNQSTKGKDFGLHTSENSSQVNGRQDIASNLQRFTESVQTAAQEISAMPKTTQAIFSQIVQKAKLINLPELAEMKIQLKPDFLGKLHLNVSVENGVVTAKFNAESHQVKAIIEANLNTLRDALSEQGVKVDQLVVNVGTGTEYSGFQEHARGQYQNLGRRNPGGITVSDEYDAGLASQILTSAMSDVYGSKVNFTA